MDKKKTIGFYSGIAAMMFILLFTNFDPQNPNVTKMSAVAFLMAIWWISEAIPLAITSLLPIILFPLLGIMNGDSAAAPYINSTIFLFLGGFLIALAMERWNLHKRIALKIILIFGSKPSRIILGFMVAAAFLSMWISNTATAVMMLPIGLSVILELEELYTKRITRKFTISLLLGIAYSCSIGGISTLIGTPPNLAYIKILHIIFPNAPEISFASWLTFALPMAIILIAFAYFLITKLLYKPHKELAVNEKIIIEQYKNLGKMSREEKLVALIFLITALLWIFRTSINLDFIKIPGWTTIFNEPTFINDGTIAIAMSIILFIIPSKNHPNEKILDEKVFTKVPWGIILLFGGGFALGEGFVQSGLSDYIGNQISGLQNLSPFLILVIVCFVMTFLTELTSNTATTQMILPILASVSVAIKINPMFLMVAATISASMAFMLPVATPPNAVIFGSNRIKVSEMARTGLLLNLIGVIVISLFVYFLGGIIFDINLNYFPSWAITK